MQTSKSVQLTDGNKVNISPMTDLMSVYYEVQDNKHIVSRKYIYNDFPCGVTLTNTSVYKLVVSKKLQSTILSITNDDKIQYNNNSSLEDILISNVKTEKISGTNYNMLISSNYNLSEILFNYESKFAFNASFYDVSKYADNLAVSILNYVHNAEQIVDVSINIQNTSINNQRHIITNLNNVISTIQQTYQSDICLDYGQLQNIVNINALVSNKIYPLKYEPMYANYNIHTSFQTLRMVNDTYAYYILYLRAISPNKFESKVQNIMAIDNLGNAVECNWEMEYDFNDNSVTWMKDEFGNEAPYDFKHLTALVNNVSMFTFSNLTNDEMSSKGNVLNNIIEQHNGCNYMPIFKAAQNICYNECNTDCPIMIIADNIYDNEIRNSSVIMVYQNNPTSQDYIKNTAIIDSSIYIECPAVNYNTFENDKFIDTSLYIDSVGVCISNSIFNNTVVTQGNLKLQYHNIQYVNVHNSDIMLGTIQQIENNITIGVDNKNVYHMFTLTNTFITGYDMCASTFIHY